MEITSVLSTVWTSDGKVGTFRHEDTPVGFTTGCERIGVDPREVIDSMTER